MPVVDQKHNQSPQEHHALAEAALNRSRAASCIKPDVAKHALEHAAQQEAEAFKKGWAARKAK